MSGPATKKIFAREFTVFGNAAFKRLASISVGRLYNLRQSTGYKKKRQYFTKTKSRSLPIGQRRKPMPEGKPGYLRIVIRVGAGYPETLIKANGKQKKRYRYQQMSTPYEKFKSLPGAGQHLKADITFDALDAQATQMSDNDAAAALQQAKQLLFQIIHEQQVA